MSIPWYGDLLTCCKVHRRLIKNKPAYKATATHAQEHGIDEKPMPRDNRARVEKAIWEIMHKVVSRELSQDLIVHRKIIVSPTKVVVWRRRSSTLR